tara:strand:+ start:65 stop:301 length:237 start_codon:yes stop_codon:yes gene_type:complete
MDSSEIIEFFLKVINEDKVKNELKLIYTPVTDKIIGHIMPYVYLALIFILINFILLLLIFTLLFQIKLPKFTNLFYKL